MKVGQEKTWENHLIRRDEKGPEPGWGWDCDGETGIHITAGPEGHSLRSSDTGPRACCGLKVCAPIHILKS